MQPIGNSIWFARMKGSNKKIVVTNLDKDLIEKYIFSTGFLGLHIYNDNFLTFFTSAIISKNFDVNRDLFASGTTQESITNEKFLEIKIPFLTDNEISEYAKKYHFFIYMLSLLRRKIEKLSKVKQELLNKYF